MENFAASNEQLLFSGVLSSAVAKAPFILSGGNITAYLDGLDAFLDEISSIAAAHNEEKLRLYLGCDNAKCGRLHSGVLIFTQNNGYHLLNLACDSPCKTESIICANSDGLQLRVYNITDVNYHAPNKIVNLENAYHVLALIKAASTDLACARSICSAIVSHCERTCGRILSMQQSLTSKPLHIADIERARDFMVLARKQIYAEANLFVMAHGQHKIIDVLTLLTM
ncbi:MAG: hypothetical protein RR754_08035 [Oscillospiraceae bacterium]